MMRDTERTISTASEISPALRPFVEALLGEACENVPNIAAEIKPIRNTCHAGSRLDVGKRW